MNLNMPNKEDSTKVTENAPANIFEEKEDDNKEYLKIGYDNRTSFSGNKSIEETKKKIISEDIIRFK